MTQSGTSQSGRAGAKRPRVALQTIVKRREQLSNSMVRLVLSGDDLARFDTDGRTDAYVKLVFPAPGVQHPEPLDLGWARENLAPHQQPRLRTYTVRAFDPASRELTIDLVVHGERGIAGPWAARVQPGEAVSLLGPGGGYRPNPDADWYLFIGDESALPAIAAAAEALPEQAIAHIFIEVDGPGDEVPISSTAALTWVHRSGHRVGERLVQAVMALESPAGTVDAFLHGEAGFVKELRRHLLEVRSVARENLSVSGYWRLGDDDEQWRAAKADWARD